MLVGNPAEVHQYYVNLVKNGGGRTMEERYGNAISEIAIKNPAAAIPELKSLVREYPRVVHFYGALGQAYLADNKLKESQEILLQAMNLFPRNVPITIRYAQTLMRAGDNKQAHSVLLDLFNNVEPTPDQTRLIAKAANDAGARADSYSYMAEFYLMSGDLKSAAGQLQLALELPGLDPIQRARFSARLQQVHDAMPKDKKNQQVADDGRGTGR